MTLAKRDNVFDEYEIVPEQARVLTEYLMRVYQKTGSPETPDSESGWRMMDAIMQAWAGFYPQEFADFRENIDHELRYERPIRDAIKADGGISLIGYPQHLYALIKVIFPTQRLQDRNFVTQMATRYPQLRTTNAKI